MGILGCAVLGWAAMQSGVKSQDFGHTFEQNDLKFFIEDFKGSWAESNLDPALMEQVKVRVIIDPTPNRIRAWNAKGVRDLEYERLLYAKKAAGELPTIEPFNGGKPRVVIFSLPFQISSSGQWHSVNFRFESLVLPRPGSNIQPYRETQSPYVLTTPGSGVHEVASVRYVRDQETFATQGTMFMTCRPVTVDLKEGAKFNLGRAEVTITKVSEFSVGDLPQKKNPFFAGSFHRDGPTSAKTSILLTSSTPINCSLEIEAANRTNGKEAASARLMSPLNFDSDRKRILIVSMDPQDQLPKVVIGATKQLHLTVDGLLSNPKE